MGTKLNPGKFDCYASAGDDEPIFILRANDPIAMLLVRLWSLLRQAEKQNESDPKALEALKCSFDMQAWLITHKIEVTPSLKQLVIDANTMGFCCTCTCHQS